MQTKKANAEKAPGAVAAKQAPAKSGKKAIETANVIETLVKKEQRFLYKFQLATPKLTPQKAKQYRQKLRRKLDNFDYKIRIIKDASERNKAITEFRAFYKAEFILNDYSLKSITDSRDTIKSQSYAEMLKLVQNAK